MARINCGTERSCQDCKIGSLPLTVREVTILALESCTGISDNPFFTRDNIPSSSLGDGLEIIVDQANRSPEVTHSDLTEAVEAYELSLTKIFARKCIG